MESIYLHFDASVAEGNRLAHELQTYLIENYQVNSQQVKESDHTQDAGAILAILLGSATVIEIAKGIAAWMQKKPEATLTISKDKDKIEIIGTGLKSKDIVETFKQAKDLLK